MTGAELRSRIARDEQAIAVSVAALRRDLSLAGWIQRSPLQVVACAFVLGIWLGYRH